MLGSRVFTQCVRLACRQPKRLLQTTTSLAKTFDIKDKSDFEKKVFAAHKPVVVDFHAEWCGPCKSLAPLLEAAVASTENQVDLAKVDIDELGELAIMYGVTSVPSVFLVKNGNLVEKFVGLQDSDFIKRFVEQVIDKK